jgi:hypothetical protein
MLGDQPAGFRHRDVGFAGKGLDLEGSSSATVRFCRRTWCSLPASIGLNTATGDEFPDKKEQNLPDPTEDRSFRNSAIEMRKAVVATIREVSAVRGRRSVAPGPFIMALLLAGMSGGTEWLISGQPNMA